MARMCMARRSAAWVFAAVLLVGTGASASFAMAQETKAPVAPGQSAAAVPSDVDAADAADAMEPAATDGAEAVATPAGDVMGTVDPVDDEAPAGAPGATEDRPGEDATGGLDAVEPAVGDGAGSDAPDASAPDAPAPVGDGSSTSDAPAADEPPQPDAPAPGPSSATDGVAASEAPAAPDAPGAPDAADGEVGGAVAGDSPASSAEADKAGARADARAGVASASADKPAFAAASSAASALGDKPSADATASASASAAANTASDAAAQAGADGWKKVGGAWYYCNAAGVPYTGERKIGGAWYYLDPAKGGARATGFARVAVSSGSGSFKTAYYGTDGRRVVGSVTVGGKSYYFADGTGAMQTGFRWDGRALRFYDASTGQMLTGQQALHGGWHNFDAKGALSTGVTKLPDKTVLYDSFDGTMRYGQQWTNGAWHYFDDVTGRMLTCTEERDRLLDCAWSLLGTSEATTWEWQGELSRLGGHWCPWGTCMTSVWHFFRACGMDRFLADGFFSGWPHEVLDRVASLGQTSWTPQVGSVVTFNMPGSFAIDLGLSSCHAELVVEVGDTYVTTIGRWDNGVGVHYYSYDYVSGYILPAYLR